MYYRPASRRGQRLMDVGRSIRAWAKAEPTIGDPLIALAQEVERSARGVLLTLAHDRKTPCTVAFAHSEGPKSSAEERAQTDLTGGTAEAASPAREGAMASSRS
jgi:hypothetical protein